MPANPDEPMRVILLHECVGHVSRKLVVCGTVSWVLWFGVVPSRESALAARRSNAEKEVLSDETLQRSQGVLSLA